MKIYVNVLLALFLFVAGCAGQTGDGAPAAAESFPLSAVSENMRPGYVQTVALNNITVLSLVDSPHIFQAGEVREMDKHPELKALMPGGKFQAVIKTYLVKTGGRLVLVDGGMGKDLGVDGRTVDILAAQGITPADVTDILLTHMDIDHVGGLIHMGKAVFPNATLHVSRPEYEAWTAGAVDRPSNQIAVGQDAAAAYKGKTKVFDYGEEVLPGIVAVDAHGHTPGHTVFDITSGNKGLTIVGDLLHVYPVQLRSPQVCTIYDTVPRAIASRERTLARLSAGDRLIAGMHFPMIGKVRVASTGGYVIVPE